MGTGTYLAAMVTVFFVPPAASLKTNVVGLSCSPHKVRQSPRSWKHRKKREESRTRACSKNTFMSIVLLATTFSSVSFSARLSLRMIWLRGARLGES